MGLMRRPVYLTLSRQEWEEIARSLTAWPESAMVSAGVVRDLLARLDSAPPQRNRMVTFSQSALSWTPLIVALSMQVQRDPALLPVAEHLQSQLQSQARRFEGPVRIDQPNLLRTWPSASGSSLRAPVNRN